MMSDTDSKQVPWGKVEKHSDNEGEKRVKLKSIKRNL